MTLRLILVISSALLVSACASSAWKNSIFDRTPPTTSVSDKINTREEAARLAEAYRGAYQARADWDAQASLALEFPLIGLAIATVAEMAYSHPHIGPAKSLAIAGGGLGVTGAYLAPRTRMNNALAGAAAMACVRDAAYGVQTWDTVVNAQRGSKDHAANVLRSFGLKTDVITRGVIQTLLGLADEEVHQLSSAIGAIKRQIEAEDTNASPEQSFGSLMDSLKLALQKSEPQKASLRAILTTENLTLTHNSPADALARTELIMKALSVDNVLDLEATLITCVGKATASPK